MAPPGFRALASALGVACFAQVTWAAEDAAAEPVQASLPIAEIQSPKAVPAATPSEPAKRAPVSAAATTPTTPGPPNTSPPTTSRSKQRTSTDPPAKPTPSIPAPACMAQLQALCAEQDSGPKPRKRRWLEFSFGSSQIFNNQSVYDPGGLLRKRIIPVGAIALFGEWLFHERFSVVGLLSWPLEPQSEIVDGQLQLQYVPPSVGLGLRATAISQRILEETALELQVAVLASTTLSSGEYDHPYPLMAWRLHLRDYDGFTLYAGTAFAFRVGALALIYGIGHRF